MSTQTKIYTYVTEADTTKLLWQAQDDEWIRLTLRLETVGPVAIGHSDALLPATSGKGRVLPTNEDIYVDLSPSSRLYIASAAVDLVSVHVNAIPGLEQLLRVLSGAHAGSGGSLPKISEQIKIGNFGFTMPKKMR
jgi:hypothetical protein